MALLYETIQRYQSVSGANRHALAVESRHIFAVSVTEAVRSKLTFLSSKLTFLSSSAFFCHAFPCLAAPLATASVSATHSLSVRRRALPSGAPWSTAGACR
jgi:hypothetical protein